jgi:hypothetical protein
MKIPLPLFVDPTTGTESFSMTAAALTLGTVLFKVAMGGLEVGGHKFEYIADSTINTLLTSVFLLYFSRKATATVETVQLAKIEGAVPAPAPAPAPTPPAANTQPS